MKLSDLKTGEHGVIVKVTGHGGFRKRIVEMGFIKGKKVDVLLNAPLQDPVKYKIMGYEVSLRRTEAEMIEVISESEAKAMGKISKYEHQTAEIIDSTDIDEQPLTEEQLEEAAIKRRHTI
ncbi:MAG: ferrous iron transport protein A, partial [Prevotella sp.]|nr:ferrous iron transport protein A [Prevotella sp.]